MGLLDVFNSDEGRLGLGLLAAAGPSQMGFGERLQGVMHGMDAHKANKMRMGLLQSQMDENAAQAQARNAAAAERQAEIERQARIRAGLPGLYGPSGFDAMGAMNLGVKVGELPQYAAVPDLGRPKATRQMEVDDGQGGKRIALVDDFGREVAGFAGYTAPVQVNQGDRISFVKPSAGMSLGVGMSPSERDASARGWAGHNLNQQRFNLDAGNAVADAGGPTQVALTRQFGKASPGYRWKNDGTQEAIPGGPADIKAGEAGAKAKARQEGAIAQANSVLEEVRAAKGMVGWNTAGVGGVSQFMPATEGRNLSAKLQTIKANLGFDRLQQMRDQSPTGGALGSVAQQELAALQATVASLDQLQSPAQLAKALDKIEHHYVNWHNTVQQSLNGSGGATGSWGIREKK
jgi:hypothetical protein